MEYQIIVLLLLLMLWNVVYILCPYVHTCSDSSALLLLLMMAYYVVSCCDEILYRQINDIHNIFDVR